MRSVFRMRAFTMLEVMVVVIILGILAAMVMPQFGGVSADARTAATQAALAGVRSSIAAYRAETVLSGSDVFPTFAQLNDPGRVLKAEIPANPFTGVSGVQAVTATQADQRAVINEQAFGWNYFVDNSSIPARAVFYANTRAETTSLTASGTKRNACDL